MLLLLLLSITNDDDCWSGSVGREMADKTNISMAETTTDVTDVGSSSIWVRWWSFFATLSFGHGFSDAAMLKQDTDVLEN